MICPECGKETSNEFSACKGACTQQRVQGVPEHLIGGVEIMSCDCCDDCRELCYQSFMDELIEIENEEKNRFCK